MSELVDLLPQAISKPIDDFNPDPIDIAGYENQGSKYVLQNNKRAFAGQFKHGHVLPGHVHMGRDSCGKFCMQGCLKCKPGTRQKIIHHCKERDCNVCWSYWRIHEANNNAVRMFSGVSVLGGPFLERTRRPIHHGVLSPPPVRYSDYNDPVPRNKMREMYVKGLRLCVDDWGGCRLFDHAYRFTQDLEKLKFSPHFHALYSGWFNMPIANQLWNEINIPGTKKVLLNNQVWMMKRMGEWDVNGRNKNGRDVETRRVPDGGYAAVNELVEYLKGANIIYLSHLPEQHDVFSCTSYILSHSTWQYPDVREIKGRMYNDMPTVVPTSTGGGILPKGWSPGLKGSEVDDETEQPTSKPRAIVTDPDLSRKRYGEQVVRGYGVFSNRGVGAKSLLKYDVELSDKIGELSETIVDCRGKIESIRMYRADVPSVYRKFNASPVKTVRMNPKTGVWPVKEAIWELVSGDEPINLKAHPAIPKSKVCKNCDQEVTDFGAMECEEQGHHLEEIENVGGKKVCVPLTQVVIEIVWKAKRANRRKDAIGPTIIERSKLFVLTLDPSLKRLCRSCGRVMTMIHQDGNLINPDRPPPKGFLNDLSEFPRMIPREERALWIDHKMWIERKSKIEEGGETRTVPTGFEYFEKGSDELKRDFGGYRYPPNDMEPVLRGKVCRQIFRSQLKADAMENRRSFDPENFLECLEYANQRAIDGGIPSEDSYAFTVVPEIFDRYKESLIQTPEGGHKE